MIVCKDKSSNLKKTWPFVVLCTIGAGLNLAALFVQDGGALVAVGCSLIAVGASSMARRRG